MPQKILQLGDSILRKKSKSVKLKSIPSNEIECIVSRLIEVMKGIKEISPNYGNGLAAPQIGSNYRIIVLYFNNKYNVLINPNITRRSNQVLEYSEGCLSFFYLRGTVKRNKVVEVAAYDEKGEKVEHVFSDNLASLVQHEIDHLDGILYLDRIKDKKKIIPIDDKYKDNKNKLDIIKDIITYVTT